MRRVVGGYDVDSAVHDSLYNRGAVVLRAYGRIDLCIRVEIFNALVVKSEIMRTGLRRDLYAFFLEESYKLHRAARADVAKMHGKPQSLGQYHFSGDGRFLRGARNPL